MRSIALIGQPNCGKSTLFNNLCKARQHVANYPGITVEKKTGNFYYHNNQYNVIDLPGTYSLTHYTPEERVTRLHLLNNSSDTNINVVDSTNLERQLLFTLELMEMNIKLVIFLNKRDMAEKRKLSIDENKLSNLLNVPIVYSSAKDIKASKKIKKILELDVSKTDFKIDYTKEIEDAITLIQKESHVSRYLAIKLLERDEEYEKKYGITGLIDKLEESYIENNGFPFSVGIALEKDSLVSSIIEQSCNFENVSEETTTDKIDKIALHRFLGPIIFLGIMFLFYQITMVGGQQLSNLLNPIFNLFRESVASILPTSSMVDISIPRGLILEGIVDGTLMIFNYLPIFFVLYLLIAILEDSGYMARIAFMMDRLFKAFGLHGQSTLPMILGGAIIGGCAVPAVMATRTIKDRKARLITMLVVPLLNCMAKVPFYVLITSIFFQSKQGLVLWLFSIATFVVALLVAKLLSVTILKGDPEPFILEIPSYQIPTVRNVVSRALERLLLFIKKVMTIILVVSVVIWCGINIPFPSKEIRENDYKEYEIAKQEFIDSIDTSYRVLLSNDKELVKLNDYLNRDRVVKQIIGTGFNKALFMNNPEFYKISRKGRISLKEDEVEEFTQYLYNFKKDKLLLERNQLRLNAQQFYNYYNNINPYYFNIVRCGNIVIKDNNIIDTDAMVASKEFKSLAKKSSKIERTTKSKTLENSILGRIGKAIEPLTKLAGLDWRINIGLIGSFAAKETMITTLGTIYSTEGNSNIRQGLVNSGITPLIALCIMVFVALFPPCLATLLVIREESQSTKWMLFSFVFPIILGFIIAALIFNIGTLFGF